MKKVAVIYTHFPHYRAPVFAALSEGRHHQFSFFYDPKGIENSILSGSKLSNHHALPVRKIGKLMWQKGVISLTKSNDIDAVILLGNPFIVSYWFAALWARLLGKPVLYWTHGWLKRDSLIKSTLRKLFYSLADGLLVYGERAREIGRAEGFDPSRIFVVNNSLDYDAQRLAREAVQASRKETVDLVPQQPYFLVVSRLVDSVGLDHAIRAMNYLPAGIVLVVVGEGPKREALQAMAKTLDADVRFVGAIYEEETLAGLFLRAQAVVSPGKVGLLAMHALAYGIPVITHDDYDFQMPEFEALEPNLTGVFFRRGDAMHLAERMNEILDWSVDCRDKCRVAAIKRIEEGYTPKRQADLINEALGAINARFSSRGKKT
jgi:glycosyltransferase involved in cell wall biosynthesis